MFFAIVILDIFLKFYGNLAIIHFYDAAFQVADKKILELEASRDLSKIWLHIDMDAFYAAVETLENPSLKGKPMAVGGMSMICTANYEVCYLYAFLIATSSSMLMNNILGLALSHVISRVFTDSGFMTYSDLGTEIWSSCCDAWFHCT